MVFCLQTESSEDEASGDEGLPHEDSDVSSVPNWLGENIKCSSSALCQKWEEEEAMEEEDVDPESRSDSKANGEDDMEHENESEEEWGGNLT